MTSIVLVDATAITPLGRDFSQSWATLLEGKTASEKINHFSTKAIEFKQAASIPWLRQEQKQNLLYYLAGESLNQLKEIPTQSHFYWCAVKGNSEAVENAKENAAFLCDQDYLEAFKKDFNLEGEMQIINTACASSSCGTILACEALQKGLCESAIVLAADLVSRFTHMGFAALKALSPKAPKPFDIQREGLNLGEAGCSLLLCREETAQQNNWPIMAKISGWGMANDANHITGPARDGCGLLQAMQQALNKAGKKPQDIEAFCAHGTATNYNDGMELTALERLFNQRRFPLFSVKGAIGHTLGAAGALEIAFCSQALKEKIIPPTCGLEFPEERAEGRAMAKVQEFAGNNLITTNSGFGGINTAILLESCK